MFIKEAFNALVEKIANLYDKREAQLIVSYIFEDVFSLKAPYPTNKQFDQWQRKILWAIELRLLAKEPWQYIVGTADFYGYKYKVSPAVLIPRPETEELVYWILESNRQAPKGFKILDIGTGSGCIALTLQKERADLELYAIDVSEEALAIAQENAQQLSVEIRFSLTDILDCNTWPQLPVFDLIVSNPPYIDYTESKNMNPNVLQYEPHLALFVSSEDPLQFYKIIIEFALAGHLKKGGYLYFEISHLYGSALCELLENKGFSAIELKNDLQGNPRMLRACLV